GPAQEAGGARPDRRGERSAPVSLRRHRRCRYQQADLPDRARDAQHASSDVQPDLRQPESGHEQPELRARLRGRHLGTGVACKSLPLPLREAKGGGGGASTARPPPPNPSRKGGGLRARREINESELDGERRNRIANVLGATRADIAILSA